MLSRLSRPHRRPARVAGSFLIAAALVAAVSCSGDDGAAPVTTEAPDTASTTAPATTTTATTAPPTTEAPPVDDDETAGGLDTETLAQIVGGLRERYAVPGVIVAVETPTESWRHASGTRDAEGTTPIEVGDHVRIGSNTKTMVGTIALQLVDEGLLRLDMAPAEVLPDLAARYPQLGEVDLTELLEMRTGFANYSNGLEFNQVLDEDPDRVWEPLELVELSLDAAPTFEPGEGWEYSNVNTILAALMAEAVTGESLTDLVASRIAAPLGLTGTSFPAIDDASLPEPHPNGYLFGTNVSSVEGPALTDDEREQALAGQLLPNDVTFTNPSWGWAAGAGISTVDDLVVYVDALVEGGLVSDELQLVRLGSIRSTTPGEPSAAGYGLAMASFGSFLGHDGSLPGFQSFMAHDPGSHTSLVVVTNLQASPDDFQTANEIARALLGELMVRPPDADAQGAAARSLADAAVAAGVPVAAGAVRVGHGDPVVSVVRGDRVPDLTDVPDDAVFRVGSVTKTFTVTRLLQLVDDGVLSLDDPIGTWFPDVANPDATLAQLADMTSGLFNYTEDVDGIVLPLLEDPTQSWDPLDLVATAEREPAYFAAGEGWHYSNTNTILLELVIEAVTGEPFPGQVRTALTEPVGLERTEYPAGPELVAPFAPGFLDLGDGLVPLTEVAPSSSAGSGAIVSTPAELARWGRALVRGDLVSPGAQLRRLATVSTEGGEGPEYDRYGLGIGTLGDWWGHTGDYLGYQALVMHHPVLDVTVVLLTDLKDVTNPAHIPTDVFRAQAPSIEELVRTGG